MSGRRRLPDLASPLEARPRLVLGLLVLLLAGQVGPWWRPTNDSCSYLSIARSLAEGEPANLGDPHLYYAPGYPALLAPFFLAGERPFLAISLLHLACAVGLLLGVFAWARRWFPERSTLLTALAMANVGVWTYQRMFLSEIPFAAGLVWGAFLLDRGLPAIGGASAPERARHDAPPRAAPVMGGAAVCAALVAVRTVGLALPAAFALALLVRAARGTVPWRRAVALGIAVAAPAVAVAVAVLLREEATAGAAVTYLDRLSDAGGTGGIDVLEGIRLRVAEAGRLFVPGMSKAYSRAGTWLHPTTLVYVPVAAVLAWGWWRLVRRTGSVLALALPLYAGVYVLWPFDQGIRFLTPVVPVLLACAVEAATPQDRVVRFVVPLFAALHLVASVGLFAREMLPGRPGDPSVPEVHARWPDVDALAREIRASPGDVAALRADRRLVLMLQLALDRPVEDARRSPPSPGTRWLLLGPADVALPGLYVTKVAGDVRLAGRR